MGEGLFCQFLDVYVAVHECVMSVLSPPVSVNAGTLKDLLFPFILNDDKMI